MQVFVVADGGLDLEHYEPRSFEELQSILMQVTMTLAVAEESCQFEHRDLHWGNLLISRDGTETVDYRFRYDMLLLFDFAVLPWEVPLPHEKINILIPYNSSPLLLQRC